MKFSETSGMTCCPMCRAEQLTYETVPEHRREFVNSDGENVTEHWPEVRDYSCDDCGAKWTMPEDQDDFR